MNLLRNDAQGSPSRRPSVRGSDQLAGGPMRHHHANRGSTVPRPPRISMPMRRRAPFSWECPQCKSVLFSANGAAKHRKTGCNPGRFY
uniref:C2H2-type domain-containing protein n=1 Tax=Caenorhabditis tropicalis TaxID=1561998 RepID=A0A1I7UD86_9PELO